MSWFDTSGIANVAKSALKEVQKTIDKALDIKEDEQKGADNSLVVDDGNFFATWMNEPTTSSFKEVAQVQQQPHQGASIWGSFTGSFFENPRVEDDNKRVLPLSESIDEGLDSKSRVSNVPLSKSLPEKLSNADDSCAATNISNELSAFDDDDDDGSTEIDDHDGNKLTETCNLYDNNDDSSENIDNNNSTMYKLNRVSLISSESDKKSSESVEILGSRSETNSQFTTTPDSEIVCSDDNSSSRSIDTKKHSESVEILPDSLVTSPSSVEIIDECSKTENSFHSPEDSNSSIDVDVEVDSNKNVSSSDISPYSSPIEESKLQISNNEDVSSPSQLFTSFPSVPVDNVIANEETDEISQAEDSYTSASDTTIMTTMETLNQQQQKKDKTNYDINMKQNLHLIFEPITTQPIRKNENLADKIESFDSNLIKSTTIEPLNQQDLQSTTILTDSSCEGTIVDTSSEDNVTLKNSKSSLKAEETILSSSSYVKNMLADAMVEKSGISEDLEHQDIPREHSPISSESRSDMVKIGSDQASGHTSGDELETTTSSDIEIISSPNGGDSSSTQSRQSPANLHGHKSTDILSKTLKMKGHSRELSEISMSSDDGIHEIERLRKRIQEINEILEVRESKLIDVSRINMDLREQNDQLKIQLKNWEMRVQQHQDFNVITDEYTQRMSVLEKKFQQTIRERDLLKDQLELLKKESNCQSTSLIIEKDEIIKQLREEGEKLSKQQLSNSTLIKKLRSKEKENEVTIKNQKEQLDEQNLELDRLKRSLNAKEEVERTQIEAVYTLTAKIKKQEKELAVLKENLDNTTHKMNAYKVSLDSAKNELNEIKLNFSSTEEELKEALNNAEESNRLLNQIENLKIKLRQEEENYIKRVDLLKQENADLLKRFETAEARCEELSESITLATKPLLRQIEQLQNNQSYKSNTFMKQEKIMTEKINELQSKLDNIITTDRSIVEENLNLKSKLTSLESQLKRITLDYNNLKELNKELNAKNDELNLQIDNMKLTIDNQDKLHSEQIRELKRELESYRDKLSMEKAAADAEKRKNLNQIDQQNQMGDDSRISPTSSLRRESISSTNSVWLAFNDSVFDTSSGRFPNVYDGLRTSTNTTSTIETLQAQLKAREGEIQTLQWELSRRNAERDALNMELSNLTIKVEELSAKLVDIDQLNLNLTDIQTRYDAMLQMYGEKVEEVQELQLDLQDVKEMYKSQIDQLMKKAS